MACQGLTNPYIRLQCHHDYNELRLIYPLMIMLNVILCNEFMLGVHKMKVNYRMRLAGFRPFAWLYGNTAVDSTARREGLYEIRNPASTDAGNSDTASQTIAPLPRRLLILPVFLVVIAMVIVFLGISWSIRAALLLLPKVKSLSEERQRHRV